MYGIIIKDDERYNYTQKFLEMQGIRFKDKPENINFILFPFKQEIDTVAFDKNFFAKLDKNVLIFSGIQNNYIKIMCQKNNLHYEPIMNSDYVSVLNAVPTSEGVISYLIQNRKKTIDDANILIIGYGRCGKILADKLLSLGANIFVNTLNKSDYAIAITNKIYPEYEISFAREKFDAIINTAPCRTISDENLALIPQNVLLIDITSLGFEINIAREKNIKSARLLAIPAKFALQTAGEILGKYIYERVLECLQEKK